MAKQKEKNMMDAVIDSLIANAFATPEQRKLFTENPQYLGLIDFYVRHSLDLHNFTVLFKTSYLPAANKSVFESKRGYQTSKYKALFNVTADDFKENVYETIRLAYVGLYHKIESFVSGLGEQRSILKETLLEDDLENGVKYDDVFKMLSKEFGVLRTDFQKDFTPRITAIRHTANRVKHDDGFLKGPEDELYILRPWLNLVPGQRMRIEEKWLFADMEYIRDYFLTIFKLIIQVTLYFMMSGSNKAKEQRGDDFSAPYTQLMSQQLDAYKNIIQNLILVLQEKPFDEDFLEKAHIVSNDTKSKLATLKIK